MCKCLDFEAAKSFDFKQNICIRLIVDFDKKCAIAKFFNRYRSKKDQIEFFLITKGLSFDIGLSSNDSRIIKCGNDDD